MSLSPGTRLGPYEIRSLLGAGGMGEVYRARDTTLGRDVALKVVPDALANDAERRARFEREAHLLAALNHPYIAQIYGFENSTGVPALVMELVEGDTLADRLSLGPLSLDDALPIARQIAEALEAAHELGIIHRDLKPANIKVRADGTVKVLDFGLGKAIDPAVSSAGATTVSIHPTQAGIILGTATYMSPEQARGQAIDRRADIWAFGCVVFEMVTARRAFDGDDLSTTLAAVLKTEPDWSALPVAAPGSLRRLLRRCLLKDPKQRLRDIGEARIAIDGTLSGPVEDAPSTTARPSPGWRRWAVPSGALLVGSLATLAISSLAGRVPAESSSVLRFALTALGTAAPSVNGFGRDVAITPDGSRVIYVGASGTTLFVRPLDQLEPTPLVRGTALRDPFVSPDSRWVGFFDGPFELKKVAITGGPPVGVARLDSFDVGATWAPDGTIIFATNVGLQRIKADGGKPERLSTPDRGRGEAGHRWPELLPGGQAVLFTVTPTRGGLDAASIALLDLRSGRVTSLLRGGTHAQYMASGHLVYATGGSLRAVAFNPARGAITGSAIPVVSEVVTTMVGAAEAGLTPNGTLVYLSGTAEARLPRRLVWVDRQGRETPLAVPPWASFYPRISPDGTRVATTGFAQSADIWLWNFRNATLTPLTSDPATDTTAVWTPDGRRVVFSSDRAGSLNLFSQAADESGGADQLTKSPNYQMPSDITPDGTRVVFTELSATTGADIMAVTLDGSHQTSSLVQTPFNERNGVVSPNGRWLAYEADDSGSYQIYVQPFPELNQRWPVSPSGGTQPVWASNGQELFYLDSEGSLMGVAVPDTSVWTASRPTRVLQGTYVVTAAGNFSPSYAIAHDGRFLMPKAPAAEMRAPHIVVVHHFDEELKRLLPVK